MSQTINTNVSSLNAQRNLSVSKEALATSLQRLSSGLRVNSSKDDAAGLAIAERMNAQVKGMNVAIRNANDAISLSQTAEGALATVTDALQRMRELAVQHASGQFSVTDKANLAAEFDALNAEIDAKLDVINTDRATYGAAMSRFSFAISNLAIAGENQSAARGRIMDADFAAETANLSRAQILQQAGSAMVAQANQLPNQVMALLRS